MYKAIPSYLNIIMLKLMSPFNLFNYQSSQYSFAQTRSVSKYFIAGTICVCLAVFICIGNWADSFLIGRNQNHQQMVLTKQQQNSLRRALYHARLGIDAFVSTSFLNNIFFLSQIQTNG